MEHVDVRRLSSTHNNIICLSCHGRNGLMLGYVSRESSLVIGQYTEKGVLELIKMSYLYKRSRIEYVLTTFCFLLLVEAPFPVRTEK